MKRVLVTGATGFTARYAIPALEAGGFEVHRLSRSVRPHERALAVDITDARAVREAVAAVRPTHVLHLAGTANLPDTEADELCRVNVSGTAHLLEACARLAAPPARIVLPSSGYVYGDTGDAPADEDRAPAPVGEYGRSKLEMERIAGRWTERLSITLVRPFNYTGAGHGEQFVVPKLVKCFRERAAEIDFLDRDLVRDFSDVRWVAEVYARLLGCPRAINPLNVCSGRATSLGALVQILVALTGYRPRLSRVPREMQTPVRTLVGSPGQLERHLGRQASRTFETTLRWMLDA